MSPELVTGAGRDALDAPNTLFLPPGDDRDCPKEGGDAVGISYTLCLGGASSSKMPPGVMVRRFEAPRAEENMESAIGEAVLLFNRAVVWIRGKEESVDGDEDGPCAAGTED